MATANLSVGIKTDGAKSRLKELKDLLASIEKQGNGIPLKVDSKQANAEVTKLQAAMRTAVASVTGALGEFSDKLHSATKGVSRRLVDDFGNVVSSAGRYGEKAGEAFQEGMNNGRKKASISNSAPTSNGTVRLSSPIAVGEATEAIEKYKKIKEIATELHGENKDILATLAMQRNEQRQINLAEAETLRLVELNSKYMQERNRALASANTGGLDRILDKYQRIDALLSKGQRGFDVATKRYGSEAVDDVSTGKTTWAYVAKDLISMNKEANAQKAKDDADFLRDSRDRIKQHLQREAAQDQSFLQEARDRYKQHNAALVAESKRTYAEMAKVYAEASFAAKERYNAQGAKIAGAAALVQGFGADSARTFLGADAFLTNLTTNLENYTRKVKDSAASHLILNRALNELHSSARGLAGSLNMLWLTWGSVAPLAAGAAIGATMRQVFTVGKDLEYQLTFVSALTGEATVKMSEFATVVRGSMVAPTEAAKAMRGLAQNGMSTAEAMQALPTILNLATAGEMELADAALGATGVMAAFNLQVNDLGRVSDVFAKAAAVSNTSVSGMVEAMKQASTIADQYGLSLEQTAASLATMAKRSIDGSAAGTALRNMMSELGAPTKKAVDALRQMGIQVYDQSGKLKDYNTILQVFHDKLVQMAPEAQNAFLADVFNDRGAKAINALINDFGKYKEILGKVTGNSKDFAKTLSDQLGDTPQGKLKKLFAEFQLSAVEAFNQSSKELGGFIDALRLAASSDEFNNFIKSTTSAVISLTQFLVEHGTTVATTVAAYAGLQIIGGTIALFVELRAALAAAGVAMTGLRVAALGLTSALTGGLALVATLAAEYFLLRDRTTEAEKAEEAYRKQLELTNKTAVDTIERMEKQINGQRLINKYMKEGMTLEQAKQKAAEGQNNEQAKTLGDEIVAKRAELKSKEDQLNAAKASQKRPLGSGMVDFGFGAYEADTSADKVKKLSDEIAAGKKTLSELETKQQNIVTGQAQSVINDALNREATQLDKLRRLNDRLIAAQDQGSAKGVKPMTQQQMNELGVLPQDQFDKLYAQKEAQVNKAMPLTYKRRDPSAEADQRNEAKALINSEKKFYDDLISMSDSYYNGKIKLEQAASQYGVKTQTEAENEITRLTDDQLKDRVSLTEYYQARLQALLRNPTLKTADRENVQTEEDHAKRKISQLSQELDIRRQIEAIKSKGQQETFDKSLRKIGSDSDKDIDKISRAPALNLLTAGDKAQQEAQLAVIDKYREAVLKAEEEVRIARSGSDKEAVTVAESRLKQIDTEMAKKKLKASNAALQSYNEQISAKYGMDRFWTKYRTDAENTAKGIEDAMTGAFSSMEGSLSKFLLTGKLGFRELAASAIASASQAMANQAVKSLLGMAVQWGLSAWAGSVSPTTSASVSASWSEGVSEATQGSGLGLKIKSAFGNVMTDSGPMQLQRYAYGGVARRPQLSMFGEGSQPEAYVPLPDGRSIPVTMQGGSGGGQNNVNISINVASDGSAKVDQQAQGKQAAELGRQMEQAVLQVLAKEKRPGGLLYS